MPLAITCFVNPHETHNMTKIVLKLRTYFEVYVDSVNLDPIIMKAKYGDSVHRFFAHVDGVFIMYDYEVVDMIAPEFIITTDLFSKEAWKELFNFLKKVFEEEEIDQKVVEYYKGLFDQISAPKIERAIESVPNELPTEYAYDCEIDSGRNMCFCQITKPHTDRPYTTVIRSFSENGLKPLFTSLFIDRSWGFSHDVQFLEQLWKHLGLLYEFGPLDLAKELKEHTEKCFPQENGQCPSAEPEVYRMTIHELKNHFNMRNKRYREVMEDLNVKRTRLLE